MAAQVAQITRFGKVFSESASDMERLRKEFNRFHCVRLRGFLEPSLLEEIRTQIERSRFEERNPFQKKLQGLEACMEFNSTLDLLQFLVNDEALFRFIERFSGCGRIRCFTGRVYRLIPNRGHLDSWHNDFFQNQKIAMSVNLGREVYQGGILQIRDHNSKKILHEVSNGGPGDALLFRLAKNLQHRVTAVEGSVAKTAFAGWFRSNPDYASFFKMRPVRKQGTWPNSLDAKVKISAQVIYRSVREEATLAHLGGGSVFRLDRIGNRMWRLLAESKSLRTTFKTMAREYEVDSAALERDLLHLVQDLHAEKFLERAGR